MCSFFRTSQRACKFPSRKEVGVEFLYFSDLCAFYSQRTLFRKNCCLPRARTVAHGRAGAARVALSRSSVRSARRVRAECVGALAKMKDNEVRGWAVLHNCVMSVDVF